MKRLIWRVPLFILRICEKISSVISRVRKLLETAPGLHLHPNIFIRFSSRSVYAISLWPVDYMYTVSSIELKGLLLNATWKEFTHHFPSFCNEEIKFIPEWRRCILVVLASSAGHFFSIAAFENCLWAFLESDVWFILDSICISILDCYARARWISP